jgi:hypothetical protein
MTRSKLSTKAVLLATGVGLSVAAFAGSQPAAAAAQPYYQQNTSLGAKAFFFLGTATAIRYFSGTSQAPP